MVLSNVDALPDHLARELLSAMQELIKVEEAGRTTRAGDSYR